MSCFIYVMLTMNTLTAAFLANNLTNDINATFAAGMVALALNLTVLLLLNFFTDK